MSAEKNHRQQSPGAESVSQCVGVLVCRCGVSDGNVRWGEHLLVRSMCGLVTEMSFRV